MAIVENVSKVVFQPKLNNGTDGQGNITTVTASVGATLALTPFVTNMSAASEKVLNIIAAASNVWSKEVVVVNRVVTSSVDTE